MRDDDWLRIPGLALCSIQEMSSWSQAKRIRRAVMLGYNDTEADQRIKKNHEILMNHYRDRYVDMMKKAEATEEEEENGEVKPAAPPSPQFGTSSNFCDKSGKRVKENNQVHTPPSTPVRKPQQQEEPRCIDTPSIPKAEKFEGFMKKSQQQQQWNNPCLPSHNAETVKQSEQLQQLHPLGVITEEEEQQEIGEEFVPDLYSHGLKGADIALFGVMRVMPAQLSDRANPSLDTPKCSTPTEEQLISWDTASDLESIDHKEEQEGVQCASAQQESIEHKEEEEVERAVEMVDVCTEKRAKPSFEVVEPLPKCANPTGKERVRRHDREPEAAAMRYVKPQDALLQSDIHRVLTEIEFDKPRVRKWVERNADLPPIRKELMDNARPRRYSNPIDDAIDCADLLVPDGVSEADREMKEEEKVFEKMVYWMNEKLNREWALKDSERIDLPALGSFVRVRVVGVRGSSGTIVPWKEFDTVNETLKSYVENCRPPRISPDLMDVAFVVLEQESDDIRWSEYRRGWVFDGNDKEVSVLVIDERRIVRVPRSALFMANMELLEKTPPPLCVKANFHRKVMPHEVTLLMLGCTADCRVDEKVEEEEEGEGVKEKEALELYFHKIDTSNDKQKVTLDVVYCSDECAGACAYHQNELKEK